MMFFPILFGMCTLVALFMLGTTMYDYLQGYLEGFNAFTLGFLYTGMAILFMILAFSG